MYWCDCYRDCNTLTAVLTREHNPVNPPLAQQVEQFLQYLRDVRQLSPHTLTNYGRDLRNLQSFCTEHELATATDIQAGDIRAFASSTPELSKMMSAVNDALALSSTSNKFATVFYADLDPASVWQHAARVDADDARDAGCEDEPWVWGDRAADAHQKANEKARFEALLAGAERPAA